jgi:hypothetical protein
MLAVKGTVPLEKSDCPLRVCVRLDREKKTVFRPVKKASGPRRPKARECRRTLQYVDTKRTEHNEGDEPLWPACHGGLM